MQVHKSHQSMMLVIMSAGHFICQVGPCIHGLLHLDQFCDRDSIDSSILNRRTICIIQLPVTKAQSANCDMVYATASKPSSCYTAMPYPARSDGSCTTCNVKNEVRELFMLHGNTCSDEALT